MDFKELLAPYMDEMLRCTRCGFCQAACPTYDALRMESAVARGKIQLLLSVLNGRLDLSPKLSYYVYRCLDCRLCQQTCLSGVHTDEIFEGARRWLAHVGALPAPLQALEQRVFASHNIAGEDNAHRTLWRENMNLEVPAGQPAEVVFFIGCVASLYPMVYSIPQAFVQVLQRAGVSFSALDGEEWCCGYPLISAGRDAGPLMEHNIAAVERLGARWLVTTCPSCYHTWKTIYPPTSFQVMHATELLAALIEEGRIRPAHPPTVRRAGDAAGPLRVTYHDPCDLGRKSGVYDAPRRVITALPGVELVEMSTHHALATCCGGGGNLESIDPELSAQIAGRRLAQAQRAKAEVLVTACQQCQRTLGMAARRQRVRMPVMDVAELLLSAMEEPA